MPVAAFFSLLDERKVAQRHLHAEYRATDPVFLTTSIPHSTAIERMGAERLPTVVTSPSALASRRYRALWGEVAERLDLV